MNPNDTNTELFYMTYIVLCYRLGRPFADGSPIPRAVQDF